MKAGASEIAAAAAPDGDLDALLDAVKKAESVCSFTKCKASVLTLGQLCLFCNRQFCLSHHIPEVRHGQQQQLTINYYYNHFHTSHSALRVVKVCQSLSQST